MCGGGLGGLLGHFDSYNSSLVISPTHYHSHADLHLHHHSHACTFASHGLVAPCTGLGLCKKRERKDVDLE